jgi:hypothetical protein
MRRPRVHLPGQLREHLGRLPVNILPSICSVTPGLAEWQVPNSHALAALNGLLARTICAAPRW